MARTAVLLLSVLLVIHHLKASETAYREGDDSETSDGVLSSRETQTEGKHRLNMTLVELLLPRPPQNDAPEIEKRMGDFDEVTHGVGYETHLDPHYYQRRDMGRHYDCAKQGPWKPIHGYSVHREPHVHGAADESGSHPQRPEHHHPPPNEVHHHSPPNEVHHHPSPSEVHHHHPPPNEVHHHPPPNEAYQPPPLNGFHHHHPPPNEVYHHPPPFPNKQINNGYGNHLEEWDQRPKEIIHGQQPPPLIRPLVVGSSITVPPMVGPHVIRPPVVGPPAVGPPLLSGGYRKLPPWRGKGGGGRGIHQGGVTRHQIRPSGGGQPTQQQVIYHVNGQQEAPLYHVHVRKPAPSIFGDDEWHHWFYSEEHGPYEHEGEESNQDHKDLSSFHQTQEHVGSGGYPEEESQEVPEESAEVGEEEEDGGYRGQYRGHNSGEQGDYPAEGQHEEQSASYEDEEGSQEQSTNVSGEKGGGQADGDKLPCEEEEEEAPAATVTEGSAPPEEEDLSYLEIMYPPPLPQPAQVITAPALEEPPHPSHLESEENLLVHHGNVQVPVQQSHVQVPLHQSHVQVPLQQSHVQVPVQQAYETSGYNSPPPKCPYADHHAVDPNHVHVHQSPSQEILPPQQESRDTRGTMPVLPPMQQYEVYEIGEDGGKDSGVIIRKPQAQQTSHFEEDVAPELVFGQRIPPKKTVLKVYGKPVPSGPGSSLLNSFAEAPNYPEEQKDGNAVLRPPPMLLRDSFPKINGMKVLLDARRKRRPTMWQGGPSGRQPVKMPSQMLLRPRRIPRRPTARMTVTLP